MRTGRGGQNWPAVWCSIRPWPWASTPLDCMRERVSLQLYWSLAWCLTQPLSLSWKIMHFFSNWWIIIKVENQNWLKEWICYCIGVFMNWKTDRIEHHIERGTRESNLCPRFAIYDQAYKNAGYSFFKSENESVTALTYGLKDPIFSLLKRNICQFWHQDKCLLSHPAGWDKPIPEVVHLWRHERQRQCI